MYKKVHYSTTQKINIVVNLCKGVSTFIITAVINVQEAEGVKELFYARKTKSATINPGIERVKVDIRERRYVKIYMCVYLPSAFTIEVNAKQARLPKNNRTSLLLRSFIFVRSPGFRFSLSVQKLHNDNKKKQLWEVFAEQSEKRRVGALRWGRDAPSRRMVSWMSSASDDGKKTAREWGAVYLPQIVWWGTGVKTRIPLLVKTSRIKPGVRKPTREGEGDRRGEFCWSALKLEE